METPRPSDGLVAHRSDPDLGDIEVPASLDAVAADPLSAAMAPSPPPPPQSHPLRMAFDTRLTLVETLAHRLLDASIPNATIVKPVHLIASGETRDGFISIPLSTDARFDWRRFMLQLENAIRAKPYALPVHFVAAILSFSLDRPILQIRWQPSIGNRLVSPKIVPQVDRTKRHALESADDEGRYTRKKQPTHQEEAVRLASLKLPDAEEKRLLRIRTMIPGLFNLADDLEVQVPNRNQVAIKIALPDMIGFHQYDTAVFTALSWFDSKDRAQSWMEPGSKQMVVQWDVAS
jgi:hypothetical protein